MSSRPPPALKQHSYKPRLPRALSQTDPLECRHPPPLRIYPPRPRPTTASQQPTHPARNRRRLLPRPRQSDPKSYSIPRPYSPTRERSATARDPVSPVSALSPSRWFHGPDGGSLDIDFGDFRGRRGPLSPRFVPIDRHPSKIDIPLDPATEGGAGADKSL